MNSHLSDGFTQELAVRDLKKRHLLNFQRSTKQHEIHPHEILEEQASGSSGDRKHER